MKKLLIMTILLSGFVIGNTAQANTKIAIVDIRALVAKSSQVQALKKEQQTKMQELDKWLKTVKADVEKQQTQDGKDKLIKKYDAEFAKKQEAIRENYTKKVQTIDKSITETIINEAKTKGYDLVLSKQGAVIYGGSDITSDLLKKIK